MNSTHKAHGSRLSALVLVTTPPSSLRRYRQCLVPYEVQVQCVVGQTCSLDPLYVEFLLPKHQSLAGDRNPHGRLGIDSLLVQDHAWSRADVRSTVGKSKNRTERPNCGAQHADGKPRSAVRAGERDSRCMKFLTDVSTGSSQSEARLDTNKGDHAAPASDFVFLFFGEVIINIEHRDRRCGVA